MTSLKINTKNISLNGKVIPGFNDLKSLFPKISKLFDEARNILSSSEVYASSGKKYFWKCSEGHTWVNSPAFVVRAKNPCKFCGNIEVWPGFNDLKTINPELAREWDSSKNFVNPSEILFKSNKIVYWKCELGHSWADSISHRLEENRNCPYCSGRRVLKGFNDLESNFSEIALEWDFDKNRNLHPSQVTSFSNKFVHWKCSSNHEWKSSINNRTSGRGCKKCSFNNSKIEESIYKEIQKIFKNYDYEILRNDRIAFSPYEIDVFIPELNIGIEVNGEYWHSEKLHKAARGSHKIKEELSKEKNIKLIVIWEALWVFNKPFVIEKLKEILTENSEIPFEMTYDYRRNDSRSVNQIMKDARKGIF